MVEGGRGPAPATGEEIRWEEIARQDPFWAVLALRGQKYGRWDSERFFATGEREIGEVMARGERLGRPRGRQLALDFGSGLGRLTRALAQRFDMAIGLDISETMVERARELNEDHRGCEFRVHRLTDLGEFTDESFDLVYSGRVLQHLSGRAEIERYLAEFVRVVRADGLIAFQLPHALALPARLEPRRRLYLLLRRLGLSPHFLYWRLGLHPMRMASVPIPEVACHLASRGGRVLDIERLDSAETGYLRESIYYVIRAGG